MDLDTEVLGRRAGVSGGHRACTCSANIKQWLAPRQTALLCPQSRISESGSLTQQKLVRSEGPGAGQGSPIQDTLSEVGSTSSVLRRVILQIRVPACLQTAPSEVKAPHLLISPTLAPLTLPQAQSGEPANVSISRLVSQG